MKLFLRIHQLQRSPVYYLIIFLGIINKNGPQMFLPAAPSSYLTFLDRGGLETARHNVKTRHQYQQHSAGLTKPRVPLVKGSLSGRKTSSRRAKETTATCTHIPAKTTSATAVSAADIGKGINNRRNHNFNDYTEPVKLFTTHIYI